MTKSIEKGTVKVVWVTNTDKIHSKMFDNAKTAEKFAEEKKDYLVFKLIKQKNMEEFTWKILPLGRYPIYKTLFSLYKNGLLAILLKRGNLLTRKKES